jgi:hypothetical protein
VAGQTVVSVPLVLEYEATLKAHADALHLSAEDVDVIVDRICEVSGHHEVYFLSRPSLRDPGDDVRSGAGGQRAV